MLVFPTRLFRPTSVTPSIVGGSQAGGRSVGGVSQYGELSGGGLWSIEFGPSSLWNRETFMAWRALEAASANGARPMIVPLADRRHQPITPQLSATPFDDLSLWDDTVEWDQAEVEAIVTSPALLRATSLSFDFTAPTPLVGGEHFSILHGGNKGWRLYRVTEVVSGGLGSGDATTIRFMPPLRASVATDTALNFDSPRCVCNAPSGLAAVLDMLRFGSSSGASFVECFPETLDS